jgi:hypothetical protein
MTSITASRDKELQCNTFSPGGAAVISQGRKPLDVTIDNAEP